MTGDVFDVAIVGAGIIGLAHAMAAARRGKRVVVFDRDAQANGASVRNFGFITVSGQEAGDCWEKARRSCDIWQDIAAAARIPILQRGLVIAAHYPESEALIDAFLASEMGAGCRKIGCDEARRSVPPLRAGSNREPRSGNSPPSSPSAMASRSASAKPCGRWSAGGSSRRRT